MACGVDDGRNRGDRYLATRPKRTFLFFFLSFTFATRNFPTITAPQKRKAIMVIITMMQVVPFPYFYYLTLLLTIILLNKGTPIHHPNSCTQKIRPKLSGARRCGLETRGSPFPANFDRRRIMSAMLHPAKCRKNNIKIK